MARYKTPLDQQKKRGPKRKPVDYEKATALAARGMEFRHIALCLGLGHATMYKYLKDDQKFKDAIDSGVAQGIAAVTGKLLQKIEKMDTTSIIFYLKCRAGWKETTIVLDKEPPKIPGSDCTNEEAEQAYIARMRDGK